MNLNARKRLGLRRQRGDDDQHVLVEHHRRCRWLSVLNLVQSFAQLPLVTLYSNLLTYLVF